MIGLLMDISREGFRFISRDPLPDFWLPGRSVVAEFRINEHVYRGNGHIRHLTRLPNAQMSLGFQFVDEAIPEAEWNQAVEHMIKQKGAGAIWFIPHGDRFHLDVVGSLTVGLVDEFKTAVKTGLILSIQLDHCSGVDGDGLELLRRCHAFNIPLAGGPESLRNDLACLGVPVAVN